MVIKLKVAINLKLSLYSVLRSCLDRLREPQGIIACCNPVPPLVRQQVNELHLLVLQARETPLLKVREDGHHLGEQALFALLCFLSVEVIL